jgi:hypothetical protein
MQIKTFTLNLHGQYNGEAIALSTSKEPRKEPTDTDELTNNSDDFPKTDKISPVIFLPLYLLAYSHIGLVRSVREGLRLNSEFLSRIKPAFTRSRLSG